MNYRPETQSYPWVISLSTQALGDGKGDLMAREEVQRG